ncbi:unnamed protein product, partial [Laminaria digitata]
VYAQNALVQCAQNARACEQNVYVCAKCACVLFFFFLFIPLIVVFAPLFWLRPSRNTVPGSHSRLFSLPPSTVRAFAFVARRGQHFLPSSTRVEFCSPTLLSALGNNW